MGIPSRLKKFLLKKSRFAYNDGNYSKSKIYSRISQLFFRDKETLDILARSYLRLNNYRQASKKYDLAKKRGFKLLDHSVNHFKSEIGNNNFVSAYKIMKTSSNDIQKDLNHRLIKSLNNLTDSERVDEIEEMEKFAPLPKDIAKLLPWSTKLGSYSKSKSTKFKTASKHNIETDRMRRELKRIKSSSSYEFSKFFANIVRKPYLSLYLPYTFPKMMYGIYRQKKGHMSKNSDFSFQIQSDDDFRDCIVLFPTNGVGFGHFTRLLAVAKSFRKINPNTEIVFFTTMPTLQILSEYNFVTYHLPGRYKYKEMEPSVWNAICEEMLNFVFTVHKPKAFIFDGAYPYRGMLNAIDSQNEKTLKAWLRRGSFKSDSKNIPAESIGKFNVIIRPGDSGEQDFGEELNHNSTIVKTNPILIHDSTSQSSEDIRLRLGIPDYAAICYLQLGAGKINDIDSEISMVLGILENFPHIYTIVGESMLGDRISYPSDKVRILRDYPNSKYFNQFDFSIIAGGYNSYHEVIDAELPSICFPNLETGRDDQLARASIASDEGAMIVIKNRTTDKVNMAIDRIANKEVRNEMRSKIKKLKKKNGAIEVAKWLNETISN